MNGPFIKSKNNIHKMMNRVIISLLPIITFGIYINIKIQYLEGTINIYGIVRLLLFIILGPTFTYFIEKFYAEYILKKSNEELKKYMKNSFSILPGIFLSLILPINTPIWLLLFGSISTIIFGKMIYGGFGKNKFNPALVGKLFVMLLYFLLIYFNILEETPIPKINFLDIIEPNDLLKKSLLGFNSSTISGVAPILSITAYIYLCLKKVIKKKIPILYIGTVFIITWIIGGINDLSIEYALYQILNGGLIFSAVFMATDPVTSPVTPIGQLIYSLCLGIFTVIFRYLIPGSEGILSSILIMNLIVPLLDNFGSQARAEAKKYGIVFIIIIIFGLSIAITIGNYYKKNIEYIYEKIYIEKII